MKRPVGARACDSWHTRTSCSKELSRIITPHQRQNRSPILSKFLTFKAIPRPWNSFEPFRFDVIAVLAKHTKSFNLGDTLSVGVDRIQRNFEPMQRRVESWRQTQISDAQAKLIFYSAFVDGRLDAQKACCPKSIAITSSRNIRSSRRETMWSLSNAFTSAFKKLDPVPQLKATAKLGEFLAQLAA
jgi:hypothetical protein